MRKIFIAGFGNVGRNLVRIIVERRLEKRVAIIGIADSGGCVIKKDGFSRDELLKILNLPRSKISTFEKYGIPNLKVIDAIKEIHPDVLVELTPSNYKTGEPGVSNTITAINEGINVVLANKSPIALLGRKIIELAREKGVELRYRATVMGATPLIPLLQSIRNSVIKVWGILNGTTNFILTLMHERKIDFNQALNEAIKLGYAEADPSLDVDGYDPAAKIAIIACTLGYDVKINEVKRISLRKISLSDVLNAERRNKVVKYIASLNIKNQQIKEISVKPIEIGKSDKLANVRGTFNGVFVKTFENQIYLEGLGAGGRPTAEAVLEDILSLTEG